MLKKSYTPKRTICKVTFTIPGDWASKKVNLVGDFNEWSRTEDSMKKNRKGDWEITKRLKPESTYKFRYLIDGEHWVNDDNADQYIANEYGSEDSVVVTGK